MSSSSPSGSGGDLSERRGIPAAKFIQDVETYLSQSSLDSNSALAFHQESEVFCPVILLFRLQQYKVVEMKLLAQQRDLQVYFSPPLCRLVPFCDEASLVAKIPDIEKCLEVVGTLEARKGTGEALLADFEVSEGIYSRACIEDTDSVCLWLGANVMLEYSCEEATALLKNNLENAKASLEVLVADLQFLRDQVTVTQVTIARIYNYDVQQRRVKQVAPTAITAADS
ncbi:hypothetical protein HID58_077092 [Brassica napus]|uniref:Prefoldin subunit 3 n=1 Tax=Brassica napus TaxID=3708 RepID=A0ABQ7YPB9_BRANA|nr:hypothetical protein HID58_077092 [Brassica napus]